MQAHNTGDFSSHKAEIAEAGIVTVFGKSHYFNSCFVAVNTIVAVIVVVNVDVDVDTAFVSH